MPEIATRRLIDDCFLHDQDRLTHDEALALLKARLGPVVDLKEVPLCDAVGATLAQDVIAPRDIPAFDNAAVDGYAFAHNSLSAGRETSLEVAHRVQAGDGVRARLAPGKVARVFTGAVIPEGADTVIMQEDARVETRGGASIVDVPAGVKPGINLRRAGEDQACGDVVVAAGVKLRPFEIAAIASAGFDRVSCYAPLRIALMSTGDEIIRPGEALGPGQVYDANHAMLAAMLGGIGCEVSDLGIMPDDAALLRKTLLAAAQGHDLIISTGGASRGEADHIVATLNDHGRLHGWQLAIKPGRPMAFGQLGDCVFLGLPGNPVAVAVCFLLYGLPVCAALSGAVWPAPRRFPVRAGFAGPKKPLRREFLRGWLETGKDGAPVARRYPRDGSGLISSLVAAGGLIEIPEEVTEIKQGDPVNFIPFSEFGIG